MSNAFQRKKTADAIARREWAAMMREHRRTRNFPSACRRESAAVRGKTQAKAAAKQGAKHVAKPQTTAAIGRAPYGDLVPQKHGGVVDTSASATRQPSGADLREELSAGRR